MRVISSSQIQDMRVSILYWNGKFLIKFERPFAEQVFKLPEEIATEQEVKALLQSEWTDLIMGRFIEMETEISSRLSKIQNVE